MAQMRRVHPRLVGAAGEQADFHERGGTITLVRQEHAGGLLAAFGYLHHALARSRTVLFQCRRDLALATAPCPRDQGEVMLFHFSFAQRAVQRHQRRAGLGQQQAAGGIPVQTVRQFQERGLRPQHAQGLDQTHGHAAAGMDRQAGRLVHHHEIVVLVKDAWQQPGKAFRGLRRLQLGGCLPQGGYAHHVPRFQAVVRARPALVNPHLAFAQNTVNTAFGDPFEDGDQEIVEALAGAGFVNFEVTDGGGGGWFCGLFHAGAIITDCWNVIVFAIVRMCTFSKFFGILSKYAKCNGFCARPKAGAGSAAPLPTGPHVPVS